MPSRIISSRTRSFLFGIFLALFAPSFVASAAPAEDCSVSCSNYCRNMVGYWQRIIASHQQYCDGPQTCIPSCQKRFADGTCNQYGPDFCSQNPLCIPRCDVRFNDGTCQRYSSDFCGDAPLTCVAHCTARWNDGSCRQWGADKCGRSVYCQKTCLARWNDGSCRAWGADECQVSDVPHALKEDL